jgi:perosamine synthetase
MHTFGHESQVKDIQQIANEFNLKIIDDAAEAFGSYSGEKHVGINSDYSVFSFNGNKIVTSGGGGAFISRDPAITEQVRSLGSTARKKHPWEISHNEIGYNYRMPNLNAALLKAQIEKIELKVQRKRKIAEIYFEFLANFDEFHVYKERKGLVSNYWLNNLVLKTGNPDELSQILASLHAKGIYARPSWEPIHSSRPYKGCPRMNLDKTNSLSKRIISLPSSEKLEGQMSLNFFKSYAYLRVK